jgi:hypothetical protein
VPAEARPPPPQLAILGGRKNEKGAPIPRQILKNRNNSYCPIAFAMLFFLIFCAAKTLQVNIRGDY